MRNRRTSTHDEVSAMVNCLLHIDQLRTIKRAIRQQCDAPSAQLSEAIACGFGFQSHAALRSTLQAKPRGQYLAFDERAFRCRLFKLTGRQPPADLSLPPLDHAGRYVDKICADSVLQIEEFRPEYVRFRLHGIPTAIEVNLDDLGSGYHRFRRSHAIKTPVQAAPYYPSRDFDDDPAYAMHRAIESLASYYREAVQAGHQPEGRWLVS
jgi:hypothetical protein